MKATGSKLIKVATLDGLDVVQDTDTKKLYVELFGSLREVKSIDDAINFIKFFNAMSELDKQGF